MEPLEEKVARFIRANRLFEGAARILLAISGGADSIALLHVTHALIAQGGINADLVCAHVNHQLRGAASDGDEAFVRARASELGLPVIVRSFDVSGFAQSEKLSIETAGRQLRLACLDEVARAEGCSWIATGHQRDDNAETVLHRLRRGTGFRGLAGIWPSRQLNNGSTLARPLLDCSRAEILAYLRTQNLCWREDLTNTDSAYTRNYIRNHLLPTLQSESNESLVAELGQLATAAQRLHQHVSEQAQEVAAEHVTSNEHERSIYATALASLPEMVAVELIRCQLAALGCGERDLTQHHYRRILELAKPGVTRRTLTLPDGFLACRQYGQMSLRHAVMPEHAGLPAHDTTIEIPGTIHCGAWRVEARALVSQGSPKAGITKNTDPFLEYFDLDRIAPPLVVRPRRNGDRFQPLGLDGPTKIGKFLTAAKIPDTWRRRALVFADRKGIVWLCPIRIAERAKVTEQTRRILVLKISDCHSLKDDAT